MTGADPPANQAVNLHSRLPLVMLATCHNADDDPVHFAYGSQSWAYADVAHQCNFGLMIAESEMGTIAKKILALIKL